jgi:hypothetical protein
MSAIYGGGQLSIFVGWIVVCILDEYVLPISYLLNHTNTFITDASLSPSANWPLATQPPPALTTGPFNSPL